MYEVAERFHQELIPQAREILAEADERGETEAAAKVRQAIDGVLARPEHQWLERERIAGVGSHTAQDVGLGREQNNVGQGGDEDAPPPDGQPGDHDPKPAPPPGPPQDVPAATKASDGKPTN